MKFDLVHEHFTARDGVSGRMIAMGMNWLEVKNAAHAFALETGQEVVIRKLAVIRAPGYVADES